MRISIKGFEKNIYNLLRSAGYHPDRGDRGEQISFCKPIRGGRYPRYHIYYDKHKEELRLHLDQKPSKYKNAPDHAGEYNGPLVEEEAERIKNILS